MGAPHRLVLPAGVALEDPLRIRGADARHLRVWRLRPGDELLVSDGAGREARARLLRLDADGAELRLSAASERDPESRLAITLYQGLARGEKVEWVVQKSTELGVARVVPVHCHRSQLTLASGQGRRLERWREIARQAARQSGRIRVPEVAEPQPFARSLEDYRAPGVLLDAEPGAAPWRIWIAGQPRPDAVSLWVGPEGGFDPEEVAAARRAGVEVARLGPRILRSETAGMIAVALAQAAWGDLGGEA